MNVKCSDANAFAKILHTLADVLGVLCMNRVQFYRGEVFGVDYDKYGISIFSGWTWFFWFSETFLMVSIISNFLPLGRTPCILFLHVTIISLVSLWLQGKLERYATLVIVQIIVLSVIPSKESFIKRQMRRINEIKEQEVERKVQKAERVKAEEEKRKRTMKNISKREEKRNKILAKKKKKKKAGTTSRWE